MNPQIPTVINQPSPIASFFFVDSDNISSLHIAVLENPPKQKSLSPPRSIDNDDTMAAFFKAVNAKIRSNKYTDYICSTRT